MLTLPYIENAVRDWASKKPEILAAWLIGSYALCRANNESDVDVIISIDESFTREEAYSYWHFKKQSLRRSIKKHFSAPVHLLLRHETSQNIEMFVNDYGILLYAKPAISPLKAKHAG